MNNPAQPQQLTAEQPKNPLHGFTLEQILNSLLSHYGGYPALAAQIKIKCFIENPSVKSSLKFLRKTPGLGLKLSNYLSGCDSTDNSAVILEKYT